MYGQSETIGAPPTTLAARILATRAAEQSVAMSASPWDADKNPVSLLTTPAVERSAANPSPGLDTQARVSRRLPRPDAPAMEETTFELHPGIAAPSASRREASAGGTLAHSPRPSSESTQTVKWHDGSPEALEWCHPQIRTIRNDATGLCGIG
ncbi:hypothetical protein PHYPSEUDO_013914 [Phytophthora pseudosyringae]|uniref:Uncharacterized protein n=1 Tax=Phytophthora pseudosyringae TaxID=221518 RepID=A0A8T1V852_9STRA|nr:hypothetical protein PHYPSEUDO_013914 [Phytophthora pseudosyringae]